MRVAAFVSALLLGFGISSASAQVQFQSASSAVGEDAGIATIGHDNAPGQLPRVSFSPGAPTTVPESATSVTIPLRLIGDATGAPVSVDYAVTGGTATGDGVDYTLLGSGTLQLNDTSATGWVLRQKPAPGDPAANQWFGDFLALDGDTAAITALNDSTAAYQAGAVYVYTRDGNEWAQQAKLVPADGQYQEWFGIHLRLDKNTLAVGARYDDVVGSDSGAVYVYERTGTQWNQVKKLWPADGDTYDQFGSGIGLSGDYLVAGCWRTPEKPGLAYIYDRQTSGTNAWGLIKRLQASDAIPGDRFGVDVCVDRETVIVGATTANGKADRTGAVYVYECNAGGVDNWGEVQKLTASDGGTGDNFGVRVAVCGDVLAVGAEQSGVGAAGAGAVYLYKRTGGVWREWTKIVSNDGKVDDWFGWYLSLTENMLSVSAVRNDGAGSNAGAVYLYQREGDNWRQIKKLTAPDAAAGDFFGSGIALSGGTVLAGARYKDNPEVDSGAAYFFEMKPENAVGLSINSDRMDEDNETVDIALSNPVNAVLTDPSTHTFTIVDDDKAPSVTLTVSSMLASANSGKAVLRVKLAGSPTQKSTRVKYRTVDGTALAGRDYVASSGYLTLDQLSRRAELPVRLIRQPDKATTSGSVGGGIPAKTFKLLLSDGKNAYLGIYSCSVGITNSITSGTMRQTSASHWELFR